MGRYVKLKQDYKYPALNEILPFRQAFLSIWPKFEHKPQRLKGESWHGVLDGTEKIRLMSPVFNQNLYEHVYEDVRPEDLPDLLDLYKIDEGRFPLLAEVKDYILEATLEKGDCIYVPSLYWMQFETQGLETSMLSFEFASNSKLVDLFYQAIIKDLHKDDGSDAYLL